jgi:hypothetical protein
MRQEIDVGNGVHEIRQLVIRPPVLLEGETWSIGKDTKAPASTRLPPRRIGAPLPAAPSCDVLLHPQT